MARKGFGMRYWLARALGATLFSGASGESESPPADYEVVARGSQPGDSEATREYYVRYALHGSYQTWRGLGSPSSEPACYSESVVGRPLPPSCR